MRFLALPLHTVPSTHPSDVRHVGACEQRLMDYSSYALSLAALFDGYDVARAVYVNKLLQKHYSMSDIGFTGHLPHGKYFLGRCYIAFASCNRWLLTRHPKQG